MPSKLPSITVRMERINHRKFAYIAYMNGRSASKESRQILLQHINKFEDDNGPITLEQLEEFEDRLNED
jgi:hypothetical protein